MQVIDSIISSITNYFYPEEIPVAAPAAPPSAIAYDTVAPSEESLRAGWRPERPRLTAPSALPRSESLSTYRMLAVTENTRAIGNEIMGGLSDRLQFEKERIREISAESMEKLRESAERARSSDFWSLLHKIATSLVSALSVVFGITVLASGGSALVGGAMIASGVLSLANFALYELHAWDWVADQIAQDNEDLRKKLLWILPGAVGILAAGIGIVGSINGVATGAVNFAEKVASVLQTGVALFGSVTTFGKGIANTEQLWTNAALKSIQARLTVEREEFALTLDKIKGSIGDFKSMNTNTRKAIESIAQSNIELVRQA